jgi:hypothetical protein
MTLYIYNCKSAKKPDGKMPDWGKKVQNSFAATRSASIQ